MKSKKKLLKSPVRKWDDTSNTYDSILLVPTGKKHESGFMHIAIIGVTYKENKEEYEICGYPDDITFEFPKEVRMDCFYPQGVLRYHECDGFFKVGLSLSTMTIYYKRGR